MIAEIANAVRKSGCGFVWITASEVLRAEIAVTSAIAQHVINGSQD
jgi:hypothetical protein